MFLTRQLSCNPVVGVAGLFLDSCRCLHMFVSLGVGVGGGLGTCGIDEVSLRDVQPETNRDVKKNTGTPRQVVPNSHNAHAPHVKTIERGHTRNMEMSHTFEIFEVDVWTWIASCVAWATMWVAIMVHF